MTFIALNTHEADPIKLALKDFDYNDLAYSQFNKVEDGAAVSVLSGNTITLTGK